MVVLIWKVVLIQGWFLFEGGAYSMVVLIQGWFLFEGGTYSMVVLNSSAGANLILYLHMSVSSRHTDRL